MIRMTSRDGFALPLALLVIGMVSVGAATIMGRLGTETQINRGAEAGLDAFALAEAGLQKFMAGRTSYGFTSMPPAPVESVTINLPGGYAEVVSRLVRPKTGTENAVYVVRSRGVRTVGANASNPEAQRTVAQFAHFFEGNMDVLAGWTSLTGLSKNGGAGTISGDDYCGAKPNVAGAAVPLNPGYDQSGGKQVPDGSPPVAYPADTPEEMADVVTIDWNAIVNEEAVAADVVIPGDSWPSFSDPEYWPVVRVNGNYSLPTSGRGLLIVTGNLTISGSLQWKGVVLAGGTVTSNGNNTVLGATVSGLNVKLGMSVPMNDVGNGNKTYRYDSCNVASALSRFSSLSPIPGTWSDHWVNW